MASTSRAARRRKKAAKRALLVLVILVLVLGAGVFAASRYYLLLDGRLYKRDVAELDLRGRSVSVEEYENLRANLPQTAVSWDVPLSGGAADAASQNISIRSFSREDLDKLEYFTNLRSVDATAAKLTTEDYELLRSALPGCEIRWSVPLSGGSFPCDAEEIVVNALSAEDLELFRYFTRLKTVDARGSRDYDEILALRSAEPELEVLWQVIFSGSAYPQDTQALLVDDPSVSVQDVSSALALLPDLKNLDAPVNTWTDEEKMQLAAAWPDVEFKWPVTIAGVKFDGTETEIDFSGRQFTAENLEELGSKGAFFENLQLVNLTDCGVSLEDVKALKKALPDTDFVFDFELYGKAINSMDTFIDFTKTKMDSTEEVESIIPLMPKLEKIDMSWCGPEPEKEHFDNETMDAMNKRYDNVRVVWTLRISYYAIRTDALGFRASSRYYGYLTDENIKEFKYCEDMLAMDVGHRNLKDLSFVYGMPQLKYLILLHWRATDLTPLGSLKNLVWLELNKLPTTSLAPLVGCTSLHDLNMTFTPFTSQKETFETLMAMPQLERLWYSPAQLTKEQEKKLQETYPDLMMHYVVDPTLDKDDPWRFDQDYYDMRDCLNIFYMSCSSRINFKIIDGVRYDLDPEFIAQQGDTTHDRERSYQW